MILVTGATGTIGKEVARNLTGLKAQFKVLARDPKKAKDLLGNVDVAKGDLSDPASLDAALKGVDKLFLLAAGTPDMPAHEANAIAAAKKAGVKHIVYLSALGADEKSSINFGKWHGAGEKAVKSSGMAWTILQPHFFMQNLIGSAGSIKGEGKIYAPMKQAKLSLVDARDIAAVAAHALVDPGHEGKTWIITGPEAVSYAQIASAIGEAIGKKVEYIDIPDAALRQSLKGMGFPDWLIGDFSGLFGFFSTGDAAFLTDTVEKVGKKKPYSIQEFAQAHAAAFK